MGEKGATWEGSDRAVARIAAAQHGVVSTRQLLTTGMSKREIDIRSRLGRLHRVHQGVYAVGHRGLSQHGVWMAAVLACDQKSRRAALSHRSAAELWGLLSPTRGHVDVTVPGDSGRKKRVGIRIHRSRTLEPTMKTCRLGIPVTTPQRTVADLQRTKPGQGGVNAKQLRRAMRQAAVLGMPLGPGTRRERTRSDLELLFKGICDRHGLPRPEVNVEVAGMEVDFLWRKRRLVVETDGYRYHRGRIAFEDDHSRDLELKTLGFDVLRFSDTQLEIESDKVAAIVMRLLVAT